MVKLETIRKDLLYSRLAPHSRLIVGGVVVGNALTLRETLKGIGNKDRECFYLMSRIVTKTKEKPYER